MPNDDEILALSTDIDNMLAAAQAFSQFATEAQRIAGELSAGLAAVQLARAGMAVVNALYGPEHAGYRDGQSTHTPD